MNELQLSRKIVIFIRNNFILRKCFASSVCKENVRVRFAPSPTGFVHLGGLRTALYNHLFAKSKNGTTIIRIEDTDQLRKVDQAAEKIIEDLNWCGIQFDEGPYFQSERKELYQKHAKLLVDLGEAYYCFCSQSRLDLLRKELLRSGEIVKYDNKCRSLSKEEVETKLRNNEDHCIRFKLNDSIVGFDDLIYGHYHCNLTEVEGDPVILKSDGFPTYHLANVVDDHLMNISHVLRGCEWLISTVKHLLIFRAFNWNPPLYGHLPLLLNSDGTKFSKRQNDLHVSYFRKTGIFPSALVNLVTRAGGGFDIDHADRDEKNLSIEELVQRFNLSKVHRNSCKLPIERLFHTNNMEIRRMIMDKNDCKMLIRQVQDCVRNYFNKSEPHLKLHIDDEYVLKVLDMVKNRINKIEDLLSLELKFMWVIPNFKFNDGETLTSQKMEVLISQLYDVNWTKESVSSFLKDFAKSQEVIFKELMGTLRLILTGLKDGPSITEIAILLGKESCIYRLKMSLEKKNV